ncbi:MAG: hypothetical protein JW836_13650 [Deltaproteobacteria bacterium]|nr:hypothetical protein [Deltaproteobacteria bacterium]
MTAKTQPPDSKAQLEMLKDFQKKTVNYVFRRLYTDVDHVDRFLVADEVGLGKTLVARGVIAKAIEHLWDKVDRVDIVYICSNYSIARQNINRLDFMGNGDSAIAERMTLLPLHTRKLTSNKVNFVSFTPGTSFDLRSSSGLMKERALIYHMLRIGWSLGSEAPPMNLLQGDVQTNNWRKHLKEFPRKEIDQTLTKHFIRALKGNNIHRRFFELAAHFPRARKYKNLSKHVRQQRNQLIGELRTILARSCVDALEPDIVILDEFQRFRNLLDGEDEVGRLAKAVFEYPGADVKVLLLSATPYKMYTMYHEQEREDHYEDFIRTIQFLFNSEEKTGNFKNLLERFREAFLDLNATDNSEWMKIRGKIERRLRKVMVRTERLSSSALEVTKGLVTAAGPLKPSDLDGFTLLDKVAGYLKAGDAVEYWKSCPYILNVMEREGYKIKKGLAQALENDSDGDLAKIFKNQQEHLLSWKKISEYQEIDPANARLRGLFSETLDRGAWKLLWIPPSLPYYRPDRGPFADPHLQDTTKTLVFSSWMVVPKTIAMMVSYEAERRMVNLFDEEAEYSRMRYRARLLEFKASRERLAGMAVFPLIYPSMTLAFGFDPLDEARVSADNGTLPEQRDILVRAETYLERRLAPFLRPFKRLDGPPDERWYWAALAALDWADYRQPVQTWLNTEKGDDAWRRMVRVAEDAEGRFYEHIQRFMDHFQKPRGLGLPPKDLIPVLAKVTIASPAVVALRSLVRVLGRSKDQKVWTRFLGASARIAMGFRSLFNLPETTSLVRGLRPNEEGRYWESVLDYCVEGNLQSIMDEYAHMLKESLGLMDKSPETGAFQLSTEIQAAVSLRTVNLEFDDILPDGPNSREPLSRHSMRCRFALRFGDGTNMEENAEVRKDLVRSAFNSPFRPFVLATTSIGQEGLDFHPYCHEICHWNLPSNPVDLEQREGRIHRYKGHAIRKNVAKAFPLELIDGNLKHKDPWAALFRLALRQREEGMIDLVPFWNYDIENGYRIRRCVPSFPLSREREHLEHLQSTLVLYRMVLGQPRQEDLVNFLRDKLLMDSNQPDLNAFQIDLSPR